GAVDGLGHSHLENALASKSLVMACQTKVRDDVVVRLQPSHAETMRVVGDSQLLVSEDVLPDGAELSPIYRNEHLTVPPATIDEHYSDWQRLVRQLTRGDSAIGATTSNAVLQ